jgi:hypothetical protein
MLMTPELLESFLKARYELRLPSGTVVLAVDQQCAPLGQWLGASGCTCAALLTGYNPGGRLRDDSLNTVAQRQLESRLANGGYTLIQGTAVDTSGHWPPEPSLLAAGISFAEAMSVARDFGQAAYLWFEADTPRLVETSQATR